MEEFVIINYKDVSLLCSQSVYYGDDIIFISNEDKLLKGTIDSIIKENQTKRVKVDEHYENLNNNNNLSLIYYVEPNKCFYPIIETYEGIRNNLHLKRVLRNQVEFKTLCGTCLIDFRESENCANFTHVCKKNKKSFAFINI